MITCPFKEPETELIVTRTEAQLLKIVLDYFTKTVRIPHSGKLRIIMEMSSKLSELLHSSTSDNFNLNRDDKEEPVLEVTGP